MDERLTGSPVIIPIVSISDKARRLIILGTAAHIALSALSPAMSGRSATRAQPSLPLIQSPPVKLFFFGSLRASPHETDIVFRSLDILAPVKADPRRLDHVEPTRPRQDTRRHDIGFAQRARVQHELERDRRGAHGAEDGEDGVDRIIVLGVQQWGGQEERDLGRARGVGAVGVLEAFEEILFFVAVVEADDGGDLDGGAAEVGDGAAGVEGADGDGLDGIGSLLAF